MLDFDAICRGWTYFWRSLLFFDCFSSIAFLRLGMAVSPTHDAKMKDADGNCFADYPGCHECIRAIHTTRHNHTTTQKQTTHNHEAGLLMRLGTVLKACTTPNFMKGRQFSILFCLILFSSPLFSRLHPLYMCVFVFHGPLAPSCTSNWASIVAPEPIFGSKILSQMPTEPRV